MSGRTKWQGVGLVMLSLTLTGVSLAGGLFAVSVNDEKRLGSRAAAEIESKVRIDRGPQGERVARIGRKLAEASGNTTYEFSYKVIVDRTLNAFALPAGYIYIYTGMLDRLTSDDQLAGVLGHETIHVTQRHFAKQYAKNSQRQLGLALLLGLTKAGKSTQTLAGIADIAVSNDYSRQDESQADLQGMEIMKKAGYNPQGMVEMLQVLQKASGDAPKLFAWTSDHPQISRRIQKAEEKAKTL